MMRLKNPPMCGLCGFPIVTKNAAVFVKGVRQHQPGLCRKTAGLKAEIADQARHYR